MLPNGRPIGAHLPLGNGLVRAADRAAEIGASAMQVFTDNPTAWRRRPRLPEELPAFRARLDDHGIAPLAVHAPYLVNLAGPDEGFHQQSVDVLAHELRVAHAYGARFVNVHIGSHRGDGVDQGVARLVAGVQGALDAAAGADDVLLVLENGSGGGFGLGATIEELARIEEALAGAGIPPTRVAFCLDTAHLWGAGYPIDTPAGVDEVLDGWAGRIGLHRLAMVHLNDSRSALGSRSDRHEHVAAGRIGARGLARFLAHPGLSHVAYYLETPGMEEGYDAVNVARAKALAAGDAVPALPAEAFTLPPRKGRRSAPPEDDGDAGAGGSARLGGRG